MGATRCGVGEGDSFYSGAMNTRHHCPLCESEDVSIRHETHTDADITYVAYGCNTCTVVWWEPFKNPGAEWYGHDDRYADRNQHPILTPNEKHRGVLSYLTEKKGLVLDVGCGVGNFLAYAQQEGWEGWGIDFDADAIKTAQHTFGLQHVSVSDVETFAKTHPDLRFDLITFFDVFEHLDNHREFIASVRSLLKPRGVIALSVPYQHAWRWLVPADLPPRHLTRNTERSLELFLRNNHFTMKLLKRIPASFYFIVLKLRFKYGKFASLGMVRKFEASQRNDTPTKRSARNQGIRTLAKIKDIFLFGIPAGVIWILLLPLRGRYTDMYVVAESDI